MSESSAEHAKPKVLITGASGLIGRLTRERLSDRYDFSGLNRRLVEGIPCLQADIANLDAIRPAFHGIDTVLHLSAFTEDVQDWDGTMRVTVQGTLNVFRAAQAAGVKRVVFMSSGSTMCAYEWDEGSPYGMMARGEYDRVPDDWPMVDETWPPRPDSPYAVGKLFGEACGRCYSDRFGMSVLVIRLGAVLDTDRPKLRRHYPGYLSQHDAVDLIDRCLSAPRSSALERSFHPGRRLSRRRYREPLPHGRKPIVFAMPYTLRWLRPGIGRSPVAARTQDSSQPMG